MNSGSIQPGLFVQDFLTFFPDLKELPAWEIPICLPGIITKMISKLDASYSVQNNIAVHKTAIIEAGTILKPPVIISENSFIAAHCYLRDGVFLGKNVKLGPGCEIKSSILLNHSSAAHFNFIGDSIIGSHVNFEAGSVIANHYNERKDKTITLSFEDVQIKTRVEKFGALVGDHCKIGANAVLSPGTILTPGTIVRRLQLIDQSPGQ